jgi:2-oxoglutarate dehydrogenase complex dehydrogenase (E1) component-like enzyme
MYLILDLLNYYLYNKISKIYYEKFIGGIMTEEELKKLAEEYQQGLREVEQVKREYNEKFENLSEEEFEKEFSNQLDEILEDAKKHPVKIERIKK